MTHNTTPPHSLTPSTYWKKTRRFTLKLLALWFVSTFTVVFFARELNHINLFGWPISFYMAAQGIMLIYLAIVVVYTVSIRRAERLLQRSNDRSYGE